MNFARLAVFVTNSLKVEVLKPIPFILRTTERHDNGIEHTVISNKPMDFGETIIND